MQTSLTDKGLAVFAFAAYHQLTSGEKVTDVVLHDGAGHSADPEAVKELETAGFAKTEQDRITFTDQGQSFLGEVLSALRAAGR